MKKFIILIGALFLTGCITRDTIDLEELTYLLNNEIDKDIKILGVFIENKEKQLKTDSIYNNFKLETQKYIDFLEGLERLSIKNKTNPFFKNQELTSEAKAFYEKSLLYLKAVNKLYPNDQINSYANYLLSVDDILIEENLYADYVYYYFAGMSENLFVYELKKRKEKTAIFQNEVLYWLLSERCVDL